MKKLLILLLCLYVYDNVQGQLLFQSSFEGSNPFAGFSTVQSCCSHSITASTLHPHHGSKSFRSEVRTNDPSVSSGYRAELTIPSLDDQGNMWYGWSMYFQANNSANNDWTGQYGVTTQWHPNNSTGSAELAIYADNGKFDITVNPSGGAGGTHQTGTLKDIQANRWYDIVFNVNWASSGGSVRVWIDGVLYFTKTNLNWLPNPYLKMGMNRWLMTNTWVVFYDNLKIGRNCTYNDVAPSSPVTPVQFISFDAKCVAGKAVITWKTAQELNSSHFDIEKSNRELDNWQFVGTVAGAGNSSEQRTYTFIDNSPGVLYRIVQYDLDGKRGIGNTFRSDCNGRKPQRVNVYDVVGRMILSKVIYTDEHSELRDAGLKGLYLLKFEDNTSKKIFIQ